MQPQSVANRIGIGIESNRPEPNRASRAKPSAAERQVEEKKWHRDPRVKEKQIRIDSKQGKGRPWMQRRLLLLCDTTVSVVFDLLKDPEKADE